MFKTGAIIVLAIVGCSSTPAAPRSEPPAVIEIEPEPIIASETRAVARDPEPPPEPVRAQPSDVESRLHAIERAGDSAWDDAAIEILIESFDRDGSKSLDTRTEIDAIPCPVFRVMDLDLKANKHAGLAATYGFAPGYIWVGSALGFQETLRPEAFAAMARCGVDDN